MMGSTLRIILSASLEIVLTVPAGWAQPVAPTRPRTDCTAEAQPDRLQSLSQEGDLVLASGRLAKLAGIRLPDGAPYREQAISWLQVRMGEAILAQAAAGPDRWNRISVRIRSLDKTSSFDWSHGLIEAGLAITDAGLDETFCQSELLALESTARERRLGLWADDRYKPMDVNQPERLRDRIGSFVLVEGRVRSIGERKQRTYLNSGGSGQKTSRSSFPGRPGNRCRTAAWAPRRSRASGSEPEAFCSLGKGQSSPLLYRT
jgi:hypothetical protein